MGIMKYVTLAALAAAGLALAGCGGGSKKPVAMGNQQMEMTDAQKAQAAYDAAAAAETAAMTARKTAEDQLAAVKKAVEPPQFARQLYYTGGDSSVVRTNAALVAAAKAAADKALADAKTALTAAEKAQTDLNALPAGTTGLAAQKKVVMGQVETVKAEIKAIEKTLTGAGTIGDYFSRVDTEAEIKDRAGETLATTAGFNNLDSTRPARRMLAALSPEATARSGSTRTGGYDGQSTAMWIQRPSNLFKTASSTPPTKVIATGDNADRRSLFYHKYDDGELPAGVMTWEQIAAKDGMLVKKAFGTDNMDVDVLPLAGMPLSSLTGSDGTVLTTYPTDISGDQYYKGVKGTLYCQGTCSAPGGKLTGKLFFKAADEFDDSYAGHYRYYWITPRNSHYTQWSEYARYGYWLAGDDTARTRVHVIADSPAPERGDLGVNSNLPATATYKGEALGLSALKLYNAGEHTGQKSARFTADVTLNAKFGEEGARKMGGKIDNFKGNAVNENWSVKLAEGAHDSFDVEGLATGSSGSTAFDKPGSWQAGAFHQGGPGRPAGMIGTFIAHFVDGSATGGFSTRIQAPAE